MRWHEVLEEGSRLDAIVFAGRTAISGSRPPEMVRWIPEGSSAQFDVGLQINTLAQTLGPSRLTSFTEQVGKHSKHGMH
jgi:hypothetical protein